MEKMDRIDSGMPSNAYCKLAERLPRRHVSILIQPRTEHVPLQQYLHRIRQADSPICQQCDSGAKEMVYHYLLECWGHARVERSELEWL